MAELSDREIGIIRTTEIFSPLADNIIRDLLVSATKILFGPYEVIFNPNTLANFMFVILTGHVRIYELAKDGAEKNLRVLSLGQVFGQEEFKANEDYLTYAESVDNVKLLVIDSVLYDKIIQANIQKVAGLVNGLADKLQELADMSEIQQFEIGLVALAQVVQEEFIHAGKRAFKLSMSPDQLAEKIGVSLKLLHDIIQEIRELEILDIQELQITVLDEDALSDLTGLE